MYSSFSVTACCDPLSRSLDSGEINQCVLLKGHGASSILPLENCISNFITTFPRPCIITCIVAQLQIKAAGLVKINQRSHTHKESIIYFDDDPTKAKLRIKKYTGAFMHQTQHLVHLLNKVM